MNNVPIKLKEKLQRRADENALRSLPLSNHSIDFSSNDYLGFAKNATIYAHTFQLLLNEDVSENGATGSRLISGNHKLYKSLEDHLSKTLNIESALVFNSGYDANVGFFSAVPQRGDIVFYDAHIHASIRDGLKMSAGKSYKFNHNDLDDLKVKYKAELERSPKDAVIYVVTESIFSMDGDTPNLKEMADFCSKEGLYLVVDEAHAIGVVGKNGVGIVQDLGIEKQVFARIVTFGKAIGCHGAAILCSHELYSYLLNFARSFIYTTGLPPHAVASIFSAFKYLNSPESEAQKRILNENIAFFKSKLSSLQIQGYFKDSDSAIQACIVPSNEKVQLISNKLNSEGFAVKAIRSPTVPEGEERIRFCLHSFNTKEEIGLLLLRLKSLL